MEKVIKHLNHFFENLPLLLRKYKLIVLTVFLTTTILLGAGANRVIMDNSLDSFFKKNDPVKKEYDNFKTIFGGDEYVYIVYRAKDGDIFSDASVKALSKLYNKLANYRINMTASETSPFDHIVEIKSLINIKFLEASDDTLYSRSLIGDRLPTNSDERELLRQKALNHPDYPHLFLSQNADYGGILLRTDFNSEIIFDNTAPEKATGLFDDDDDFTDDFAEYDTATIHSMAPVKLKFKKTELTEYPVLISALRDLLKQKQFSSALEFHPVGTPVMMDFFADAVFNDIGKIMGLVLLLITVMLWILFRSLSAVAWPMVIIISTLVWVTGLIGWTGIHMSIMFQIIIFLILAVGVADSVHIMSGYLFFREKGLEHTEALSSVMKKSGLACFLTSTTTAAGLLSLTLVPVRPITVFGIFSAAGVVTAFLLTVTLMPLMLDLWSGVPKKKKAVTKNEKSHLVQRLLQKTENTGVNNPGQVILVFGLVGMILFIGLMKLRIDSDEVEVLKKGLPLRHSYNLVNYYMGGTGNMEISINLKTEDALKNPNVLYKIDELQKYLKEVEGSKVVKTLSIVNLVKDSYKALNGGNQAFYKIPEDPEVLGQTLFLFGNANPKDRRRLVTDDYSMARIGINSKNAGSIEALAFKDTVQKYIDVNFSELKTAYPGCEIILTGNMTLLAVMLDYISWSQIKSFGLTLVVISVILFIVFGNIKAGLIAIIPNIFPILTSFGLMGFLGIPLDMDTLLIAPVIIGLAVDDTIHFMTHFRLEVDKSGDISKAAISSIREAGQAICFTSVILAAGFSMFTLSFHNGLSHFGVFSAIAILTAFIADIYLLPALCVFTGLDFKKRGFVLNENAVVTNET